jgi:hypothetical protein
MEMLAYLEIATAVIPLTLTKRAKDTIHKINIIKSTGQWMKVPLNGKSHRRARRMERPATTSV